VKILVLGGTGLLGCSLVPELRLAGHEVLVHSYLQEGLRADLTDSHSTAELLSGVRPDYLINLVCLSDVDACERDISAAFRLNVLVLENVCVWLKLNPMVRLIHVSSDHVYDGDGANQESNISIKNVYALSKYCAEKVAMERGACILRTNFFGSSQCFNRQTFSDWIIESLHQEKSVTFFDDVMFSPIQMKTLANIIVRVIDRFSGGVFNVGSKNGMSKSDFAFLIAKSLGLSTENVCVGSASGSGLSCRPKGMMMESQKFEETFLFPLPSLMEEVENFCTTYREEHKGTT